MSERLAAIAQRNTSDQTVLPATRQLPRKVNKFLLAYPILFKSVDLCDRILNYCNVLMSS